MGTISIVLVLTLAFAAANLFVQLWAMERVRRSEAPKLPSRTIPLEHPFYTRFEGAPRTRTDRHDLQLGMGQDFAAPDVEESVWPRDPQR